MSIKQQIKTQVNLIKETFLNLINILEENKQCKDLKLMEKQNEIINQEIEKFSQQTNELYKLFQDSNFLY